MSFFAGMHGPRCHVNTTLSDKIFLCEYQRFACWLKNIFLIHVQKFMLPIYIVLEICGLKIVVSFNFVLSAPHVKRHVKSSVPQAAAAISALQITVFHVFDIFIQLLALPWSRTLHIKARLRQFSCFMWILYHILIIVGGGLPYSLFLCPFYWYRLTLIPAWISNLMTDKAWDEITYPFHWSLRMDK